MCSCILDRYRTRAGAHNSPTYDTTVFAVTGLVGPFHSDAYCNSMNMKNRF